VYNLIEKPIMKGSKMKITKLKLNGSSIINGIRFVYFEAHLSNGSVVKMEKNTLTGQFQVGIGRSKDRDENQFNSVYGALNGNKTKEHKSGSFDLELDVEKGTLLVNNTYEYGDEQNPVTETAYNRIVKIVTGESPNRAWKELKKFSVKKLA